jgi:hypothetical protein
MRSGLGLTIRGLGLQIQGGRVTDWSWGLRVAYFVA